MLRIVAVALAGALSLSAVAVAQDDLSDDPIQTRKTIMRSNGAAAGLAGAMMKGEAPFSPQAANLIFRAFNEAGHTFDDYFPEGTERGGPNTNGQETRAAPAIWEDRAAFEAAVDKLRNDAAAGVEAKPATLEAFQPLFAQVAQNCQSCHERFRLPE